jgi:hypothetical protein
MIAKVQQASALAMGTIVEGEELEVVSNLKKEDRSKTCKHL